MSKVLVFTDLEFENNDERGGGRQTRDKRKGKQRGRCRTARVRGEKERLRENSEGKREKMRQR